MVNSLSGSYRDAFSRRDFLIRSGSLSAGLLWADSVAAPSFVRGDVNAEEALIAITLDLEMARNYPTWDQTHWDYEKGNLDFDSKQYTLGAARVVKSNGGLIHCFVVGRVLEQENVDWLKEIVQEGHPVGNHTYDHVNIRATRLESLQPRFRRAPWLIQGKTPGQVIAENIQMTSMALQERVGVKPAGFRAPGGFPNGIAEYPEVQELLKSQGYEWISTKYVSHEVGSEYVPHFRELRSEEPSREVYDSVLKAQRPSQPSVYPSGLIEIPMCPVSDLIAFRTGRWRLEHFLKATREIVQQVIEQRLVWVFLGHPSCLSVEDPELRTVRLISDLVRRSNGKARIVDLDTIAKRVKRRQAAPG